MLHTVATYQHTMRLSSRVVQCAEENIYYSSLGGWAVTPKTKKNKKRFSEMKYLYTYKFAFKKVHN